MFECRDSRSRSAFRENVAVGANGSHDEDLKHTREFPASLTIMCLRTFLSVTDDSLFVLPHMTPVP